MKLHASSVVFGLWVVLCVGPRAWSQEPPRFDRIQIQTNREILLKLVAPSGARFQIDASTDLSLWSPLHTLAGASTAEHTDSEAPFLGRRYYRVSQLTAADALTGDHLPTDDGGVVIHPVNHAAFVLRWSGKMIYNDPVGSASTFAGLAKADLILVSHSHGDHFSASAIDLVRTPTTVIVVPRAVLGSLSAAARLQAVVLTNGASTNLLGLSVQAVPAYNANHPRGDGNGYVITIGGKRIYASGDTGNTPEMRALNGIDVAFLCMNMPFTMSVTDAANATRAFRPRVIYPYHFRNSDNSFSDLNAFKRQVGLDAATEVRIRKWY